MKGPLANDNGEVTESDFATIPDPFMLTMDAAIESIAAEADDPEELSFVAHRLIVSGMCMLVNRTPCGREGAAAFLLKLHSHLQTPVKLHA